MQQQSNLNPAAMLMMAIFLVLIVALAARSAPHSSIHAKSVAASTTPYGNWGLSAVHAPEAWHYTTGAGTTICDVDTGIASSNKDVAGRVLAGINTVGGTSYEDDNGHGDHTAGIAAGNGLIRGVAPDAKLLIAKVLDSQGDGDPTTVDAGIIWCANHHASVINMSLGGPDVNYDGMKQAVRYACRHDVAIAVAAGNDGEGMIHIHPGDIRSPCLIAVSAMDQSGNLASFTNWRVNPREVVAPGQNIISDWLNGTVTYASGTSMATPFVAGELALVRSYGYSASDAVNIVLASAHRPPGSNKFMWGYGLINVLDAVGLAYLG